MKSWNPSEGSQAKKKRNIFLLFGRKDVEMLNKNNIDNLIENNVKDLIKQGRFKECKNFLQHGDVSVLSHSINVARISLNIATKFKIKIDADSLVRGALLHDYFLYDWHDGNPKRRIHGFTHPTTALNNAKEDYDINDIEADIIKKHMFPLTIIPPKYKESWIVTIADKVSAVSETVRCWKKRYRTRKIAYENI